MGKKTSRRKGGQRGRGSIHLTPRPYFEGFSQSGGCREQQPLGGINAGPTSPAALCVLGRIFRPWLGSETAVVTQGSGAIYT